GVDTGTDTGESQKDPTAIVFARDFTQLGNAIEENDRGIDPVLSCISNRRYPSIAAKRVRSSRGIVCAWDFSWNPILSPCDTFCGDYCFMHVVGTNGTRWPSDGPPELAGPHPGLCNTQTPSTAFSDDQSLRAWID